MMAGCTVLITSILFFVFVYALSVTNPATVTYEQNGVVKTIKGDVRRGTNSVTVIDPKTGQTTVIVGPCAITYDE